MNQKQFSYFLEVYRCRSIQAAADKLYLSHQGLSRVIRTLEEELGGTLFTRSNRGLEPTEFARTLLPHVQRLLEDYAAIQGVHTLTAQKKAVVSVCALDHLFGFLGAELLQSFQAQHPEITLRILDTTENCALESLSAGQCDFAVVSGPIDHTRFCAEPLFYARRCVRMNRDHPLAGKEQLRFEDLAGQRIIGRGRACRGFRALIDRHLLESGIDMDIPIETSDEELLMQLAESNWGIALSYDFSALGHCGPHTVLRYLDGELAGEQIYLAECRKAPPDKAGRAFKTFLLSHFQTKE